MALNDSSIDWGKAAAAWASQKRDELPLNQSVSLPRPPQQAFANPIMSPAFPMINPMSAVGFPIMYNPSLNTDGVGGSSAVPVAGLSQQPRNLARAPLFMPGGYGAQLVPRPKDSSFFMSNNQQQFQYGSQVTVTPYDEYSRSNNLMFQSSTLKLVPQWLKEAAKVEKTESDSALLTSVDSGARDVHIASDDKNMEENGDSSRSNMLHYSSTVVTRTGADVKNNTATQEKLNSTPSTLPLNSVTMTGADAYVPTISAGPVAASSMASRPQLGPLGMQSSLLPMTRHPSLIAHPQPNHHQAIQHSMLIGPAASAPPLHLQLALPVSMSSRRSYGPPVPDPTLEADEEILDEREPYDNGGLPFFNYEELTKGLFRSSPDAVVFPLSEPVNESEPDSLKTTGNEVGNSTLPRREYIGPYVKVVTYSKEGQELGNILLNGRKCIIFGSNSKQAHVIDNHTSVYSQHCAISICTKGKASAKSSYQSCGLFLFSLGGSTKVLKPEQVPFLNSNAGEKLEEGTKQDSCGEKKNCPEQLYSAAQTQEGPLNSDPTGAIREVTAAAAEQSIHGDEETSTVGNDKPLVLPVLPLLKVNKPTDPNEAVEILIDAGRRREVSVNTQVYIQLSSSRRYYLIDASYWDVISVQVDGSQELKYRTANTPITNTEPEVVEEESTDKHRRVESSSRRDDRSRSRLSSHRHNRRRRALSPGEKRRCSYEKRSGRRGSRYERSVTRSPSTGKRTHSRRYSSHRRYRERSLSYTAKQSKDKEGARKKYRSSSSRDDYSDSYTRSRKHHYD